jgi:hypothetical protein
MRCNLSFVVLFGSLFFTSQSQAVLTPVNTLGEWGSSSSLSLQGIIDARGNTLVDIASDAHQLDDSRDSHWTSIGGSSAGMVIEVAGYAPHNTFGLYSVADPNQRLEVFGGGVTGGGTASVVSPWSTFGFYLENLNAGFTWYSDTALNAGGAKDHMVAYQGKGEMLNLGSDPSNPGGSVLWDGNSYVLGWEDLNLGDWDYNDMVVTVSNVRPVPDASGTLALLGVALLAMTAIRRRI